MNWEASKIPGVPQDKLPKTRCRAFRSAWDKGYRAGVLDQPITVNPYEDVRDTYRNSVTWSRAFRRYWLDGWEAGRRRAQ